MSDSDAHARLEAVERHAALRWRRPPYLPPGHASDTWVGDEHSRGRLVLRICRIGDPGRLLTEAKVGRALPATVGYPTVLGYGWTRDDHDVTWSMTRQLDGASLTDAWDELDGRQRATAVREAAERVRALHRWRPSGAVTDRLLARPVKDSPAGVVGSTISPLPLHRLQLLRVVPEVDRSLVEEAVDWLTAHADLAPALDRPGLAVTHQDLHLAKLWWDGRGVRALLDLEWVRLAEPWHELARVLDQVDADGELGRDAHDQLQGALRAAGVGAGQDRLGERLRFSRVAFAVRQLFARSAPAEVPGGLPRDHPVAVLTRLLG